MSDYLYHVTNLDNAYDIAVDGLKTHYPWDFTDQGEWPDGSRQRRSYFSQRPLLDFAPPEGEAVVLRVPTSAAQFKRESYTGDWYATRTIPPHLIEIEGESGGRTRWLPIAEL